MKKILSLILALALLFSLAACSGENKNEQTKLGVMIRQNISEEDFVELGRENDEAFKAENMGAVYVDTLNDALMMVKTAKADHFVTNSATAEYLIARDTSLKAVPLPVKNTLHILSLTEKTELNEKLNDTIRELKANKTLDKLYDEYVNACIEDCKHEAITMPVFEGAKTLKIGVSGDIPPIDYVNEKGEPVGYNMVFLEEIAKKLKVNIDVQVIDSGSRFAALSSGKIDAFFWHMSTGTEFGEDETVYALSESYADLIVTRVFLK